jgi:hypothetical protein
MNYSLQSSGRQIRVFVPSTFRDMHAERDELIKRVFPQLRKLCEARGVTWGEVDLRWGITEEQSQRGEVLPICLAEIQRCRPYFIGLLSERYGWVPDEIPPELIEQQPWLKGHLQYSVTELEILHGVLNDPQMAGRTLFYFRDPAFIDALPPDEQNDYRELPTVEEIARYGQPEAERRAAERRQKLASLKERIRAHGRQSGNEVRENYANPQALGELVLRDFTALIDRLYPPGSEPDPLDREALDHEAFAQSRARVYIGRQSYYDRLDEHARSDGQPLVVLGESGAGKSALLSNWALRYRAAHPDELLLMHFIGATPYSADWAAMLRRVMNEFKRRFEIQQEIPDKPDELRAAFANWLHMAAAKGKVVLILDALNQLEDREGAPDLVWLPPVIPANIRLILSTLPGRPLEELKRRGWPTMDITPLQPPERLKLLWRYLRQYSKRLSKSRRRHIIAATQTTNPLYLRALLDELRVFGVHEKLDARIEHYLTATSVDELYEKILERYEQDYERERPGLVREAMSLLWAARRGLSEAELLELLGTEQGPLPQAQWSPLYLAAEQSLVSRAGLIGFGHEYLRLAVQQRYLSDGGQQAEMHLRLASYFEKQELGARKIDEIPWQLAEARAWQRLYDLLAEREFFRAMWNANRFELEGYWARIEGDSSLRIVNAYRTVIDEPTRDTTYSWLIGILLIDTSHPEEALKLLGSLAEHFRQAGDWESLGASLGNQALILNNRGELDEAMRLHKATEHIFREFGNKNGLQASLGNQASIFHERGELDKAMRLYEEQERICRELSIKDGLQTSLGNQALILADTGKLDEAIQLHRKEERICRELGNKNGLQTSLGNQARILKARGELEEAMRLHKEEEHLCRELGNESGLQMSLGNQALILADKGELDEAMRLHKEEERICRELGNKDGLSKSLGNQANILYTIGELDEALRLHKETGRICHELGNKSGLQVSLGNQALILADKGELDEAMRLHKEEERICRELSNIEGIATSLINQSSLLARDRGQPHGALPLAEEAYRLAVGHGLIALVKKIKPILDFVKSRVAAQQPVYTSSPHPAADAEKAAQLNIQFQQELARWKQELAGWKALPWWKRRTVKRPEPPRRDSD